MAITIFRIYLTKQKRFVTRALDDRSVWEDKRDVDKFVLYQADEFKNEAEIREYQLVPVDPAECPDCHQMWPKNEVVLANGELGCACKLNYGSAIR